jgi:LacI family transcriptional regulator
VAIFAAIASRTAWAPCPAVARPPLTTIDMNLGEIGRIAALRLLAQIDATAPREAGATTVPCRLIVRDSA